MNRGVFKKIKHTEPEGVGVPVSTEPAWSCGNTVPTTWSPEELKILNKRCLRDNYKRGAISKELYKKMLKWESNDEKMVRE